MLIDRNTQISQLRYFGIIDNLVFSILRSNGFRSVDDVMKFRDFESLGIKDYVVKSLKSFLRQILMYEAPLASVREEEKQNKNPQLDQAVADALADSEIAAAREEGTLIFNDVVDVVSFLLIDTDDEYYAWLQQKELDDVREMDALVTTYKLLLKIKENLSSANKYNLYIRIIDHVLNLDRFRDVAWQLSKNHQQQQVQDVPSEASDVPVPDNLVDGGVEAEDNAPLSDNAEMQPANEYYDNYNRNDYRDNRNFRNDRNGFRDGHNGFRDDRNGFRDDRRNNFRERNNNFRDNRNNFRDRNDFHGNNFDFRDNNNWEQQGRRSVPLWNDGRDDMSDMNAPVDMHSTAANKLSPFRMVDDEEVLQAAKDFFFANGHYPMFSILISYMKKAKVMGTVRMASVIGVAESKDKDDWTKMEARRRYIDGVNRGLGIPADPDLQAILSSEQWALYDFDKYTYFSANNYPLDELCEKEKIDISFNLFAFLLCIIKNMAMINFQVGKPQEGDSCADNTARTYVVPIEFTNFSYTSFVTVTGNRMKEFENDREAYKAFLIASLGKRFWRGENLTQGKKKFLGIIKEVIADVFGIYADDTTIIDEIDVQDEEPKKVKVKEEKVEVEGEEKTKRKYTKRNGKLTILDAIIQVLQEKGPMMSSDIVKGVLEKNPNAKESSIKVIIANARSGGKIEYKPSGLLGIVEEEKA